MPYSDTSFDYEQKSDSGKVKQKSFKLDFSHMVWQADRNSDRSSCADHPVCFAWNPYSDHGGGRRDHFYLVRFRPR